MDGPSVKKTISQRVDQINAIHSERHHRFLEVGHMVLSVFSRCLCNMHLLRSRRLCAGMYCVGSASGHPTRRWEHSQRPMSRADGSQDALCWSSSFTSPRCLQKGLKREAVIRPTCTHAMACLQETWQCKKHKAEAKQQKSFRT